MIATFDELLGKLDHLLEVLRESEPANDSFVVSADGAVLEQADLDQEVDLEAD
jgi:hypothetical protein